MERVEILGMFMKALDDCGKEGALALVRKYGAMAGEGFFREELKSCPGVLISSSRCPA